METSKLDQLKIEREPEVEAGPNRWPWIIIILLLLSAAAYWSYLKQDVAIEVRTAVAREISSQVASTVLNASGYVTARRQATVSSKFTGKVMEVLIEEGMEVEQLDRIIASLAQAARDAGVQVVAGDTKVLPRGEGGGLYLATTGVGIRSTDCRLGLGRIKPGDRILLCTDGLTDMVSEAVIAATLTGEPNNQNACQILVQQANQAGGHDNITVLLIEWT